MQIKQPLRDEVLVRVLKRPRFLDAIYLPDQSKDEESEGIVLLLGPRCQGLVKRGDRVMFAEGRCARLTLGDIVYRLIKESELLATMEEGVE